jgi:transcriptional repressor NrdR
MRCPYCKASETSVLDSRPSPDGATIRRRRACLRCERRFTTQERAEVERTLVIKESGKSAPYDRGKLLDSVRAALYRKTKDASERDALESTAQGIVEAVEARVLGRSGALLTRQIAEVVMEELLRRNQVAYLRYASAYYAFGSLGQVAEHLASISGEPLAPAI